MRSGIVPACVLAFVACGFLSTSARASFHIMQIEQVIGGVNGDVTAQAIQLRMRTSFQNQMQFSRLVAWNAAGINPVVVATFASPVANFDTGARILVTSANFNAHTSPTCVADRTMTNLIPASYLTAGSLTFEDTGGTIYWRLSWGGAGYSGSGLGNTTNDLDGNFSPPFSGAMPSSGAIALKFLNSATAASTNNAADYNNTSAAAVFNNNAGITNFTVQAASPTGACCLPSGNCQNGMQQTDCTNVQGVYQGNGVLCLNVNCPQPSGACCLPTGVCFAGPPSECASSGGVFQGPGSKCAQVSCPQPGACCLPNHTCVQSGTIGNGACLGMGGNYRGDNTVCANVNCNSCAPDIAPPNGNGVVNVDDLLAVINGWGRCAPPCPRSCAADITHNCFVNVDDLLAVINGWGPCP